MKKLNGKVNRKDKTIYINLTPDDIKNLDCNYLWYTTIKITMNDFLFSFASKPMQDNFNDLDYGKF